MRIFAVLCLLLSGSAAASASSFVTLPAIKARLSPSIVMLGEPAAEAATPVAPAPPPSIVAAEPEKPVRVSASIVAFGAPVSFEAVAAVPKQRAPEALPTVMRGGLLGEAQIRTAPAEAAVPAARRGTSRRHPVRETPPGPAIPEPDAAAPPPAVRQPE
ncbi:MAG: hypothetical protein ABTQ31_05950 [Rhizobiaceae bacterium]